MMRSGKKVTVVLTLFLIVMLMLGLRSVFAQREKPGQTAKVLQFETWLPPVDPAVKLSQEVWGKGLEDATNGAVKVQFQLAGVMGRPPEISERIISGISNMGLFGPGYTPGVFPLTGLFHMPFRVMSAEKVTGAMLEMYDKGYFDKEFSRFKFIGIQCIGPYTWHSKKKMASVAEIRGVKIRAPTEGHAVILKALGAVPVSMSSGEVYGSLEKGIIDSDYGPYATVPVYKLHEVTKYRVDIDTPTFVFIYGMNMATWDALPDAGKEYINRNIKSFSIEAARKFDAIKKPAEEMFLRMPGREIITFPPGEIEKIGTALTPVWEKWKADMEAKGLPAGKATHDLYQILTKAGVEKPFFGYVPR